MPGVENVEAAVRHDKPLASRPDQLTPRRDTGGGIDLVPKIDHVRMLRDGAGLARRRGGL